MVFLAEYEFKVEYRSGVSNGAADYLSRTVPAGPPLTSEADEGDLVAALDSTIATEHPALELYLHDISRYLQCLKIFEEEEVKRRSIKRMAKHFMVWEGKLLRRTKNGLRPVPFITERTAILHTFHDDIGHWHK